MKAPFFEVFMDNPIAWYQLISWTWFIPFMIALPVSLLLLWARKKSATFQVKGEQVGVLTVASLILPMSMVFITYERQHWHGERYFHQIEQWEAEAKQVAGLGLRPEFQALADFVRKHHDGGIGSMVGISDYLDHAAMSASYLSDSQYVAFQKFLDACMNTPEASKGLHEVIAWYPMGVSEAKAYAITLSKDERFDEKCQWAIPLILSDA